MQEEFAIKILFWHRKYKGDFNVICKNRILVAILHKYYLYLTNIGINQNLDKRSS